MGRPLRLTFGEEGPASDWEEHEKAFQMVVVIDFLNGWWRRVTGPCNYLFASLLKVKVIIKS